MKYLDFRNLNLTSLPENIDLNVEYLDLSFNSLSTLPDNFECYQNLKILFLSNNNFSEIPKIISKMKNLFMLSFRNNKIVEVDNIPQSLEWLILTNNLINKIVNLGNLINLRKLMLSGNMLNSLSFEIVKCQKLELIRLSNNQFNSVPQCIFELNNLAWISMANNPCFPLPKLNPDKQYINRENVKYIEPIGEGTSGIVYKSMFKNKEVAIKKYKGKMTSDGLSTNEIFILSSIKAHNNLIEVIGYLYGEKKEDIDGIIMPLFKEYNSIGLPPTFETVTRDFYEKKIINPKYIIEQIENVVNHLHTNNIIHGDLYAHNIIYNAYKKHAVLTDFGASFIISNKDLLNKFIKIENRALNILKNELIKMI
jgi:Leucine-rich repeat (LRR) protein